MIRILKMAARDRQQGRGIVAGLVAQATSSSKMIAAKYLWILRRINKGRVSGCFRRRSPCRQRQLSGMSTTV
ncbi:MAG: hypothetical protein HYY97_08520 [Rhodocyclales bacterium]|nr:hypothetical protein [Rhodocyclales bacterium]